MTRLLDPSSTIAIILGAYDWSRAGLPDAPSFRRSAGALNAYLLAGSPHGLSLRPDLVINLFNDPSPANWQLRRINDELKALVREYEQEQHPIQDVLIYYIGHGTGEAGQHLHLLIRDSSKGIEEQSSISAPDLAHVLRVSAPQQRRLVILDCCFSEAAADGFGAMGALDEAVAATAGKDLHPDRSPPKRGTLLLASSPRGRASIGIPTAQRTLFTGALLKVLQEGSKSRTSNMLSFADLREEVYDQMLRDVDAPPRPALHQPDQREGDLTQLPAFPNAAFFDHIGRDEAVRGHIVDVRFAEQAAPEAEEKRRGELTAREAEEARKASDQALTIRIPVHMMVTINKVIRTSRQMLHELGREPQPEELAEKLGMPLEKVREVLRIAKEPISLETPIGDEEDSQFGDFIENNAAEEAARAFDVFILHNRYEAGARHIA